MLKNQYIFTSDRLGFRNWLKEDIEQFAKINADLEIMKYFSKPLTFIESEKQIYRYKKHYDKYGYNYFATELLDSGEFIGAVGLGYKDYKAKFNPATDIGWRLKKNVWNKGYATEGARKCLEYGFNKLNLKKIISTCTITNIKSENIMKKIGMIKKGEFNHPNLIGSPHLEKCVWYEINTEQYSISN